MGQNPASIGPNTAARPPDMPKPLFETVWMKVGLPEPLVDVLDRHCSEHNESRSDVARRCLSRELGYEGPSAEQVNEERRRLGMPGSRNAPPPTEVMFDAATGRFETREEYEARIARQSRPTPPPAKPVKRAFEIPADANESEVRLLTRWPDWAPKPGMTAGELLYMPRDWVNKEGRTLTEQEDTGWNDEGMQYWPPGEVPK